MKKKKPDFEAIRDKLAEARDFLSELRQHRRLQERPEKPPAHKFRNNLSAFLTAARSVTDLIESNVKQNWKNDLTVSERDLDKWFRNTRRKSVHKGRIDTISESRKVPVPYEYDLHRMHVVRFGFQDMFSGESYAYVQIHYFDFNGERREVVELCEVYFALLDRVVEKLAQ